LGGSVIVDEVDGADVSGTALAAIVQNKAGSVDASGTSESISLTNAITAGNASWGGFHHQAAENSTNGSGYTSLGNGNHSGPNSSLFSEYKSAGSQTVDASWTTSSAKGGIAVEIKAASSQITGTLAVTEENDAIASASTLLLQGSSSITEAGDTLGAASTLKLQAAAAITEAGDTLASASTLLIQGTASITEQGDTAAGAGTETIRGSAAITEEGDVLSAAGTLLIQGALNVTEEYDTLSAAGGSGTPIPAPDVFAGGGVFYEGGRGPKDTSPRVNPTRLERQTREEEEILIL